MIVERKVGWYPGDDVREPGFAACALMDDGLLVLPYDHPGTFQTELEAAALLPRIEDSEDGPRIRRHLRLVVG